MANKLFVGGLPFSYTEEQLRELAAQHGELVSVAVIMDKFTNQSKGFGFIEYSSAEEAKAATEALNGFEIDGRKITVNEARPPRPREDRDRGSNGGGGGGYNRGGGGNRY